MKQATACLLCRQGRVDVLLDFQKQPVWHGYWRHGEPRPTFPLAWGRCDACGLTQILEPMPVPALVAPYAWAMLKEPGEHMDALVQIVRSLPGIDEASRIWGVSRHDEPLLDALRAAGFLNVSGLNLNRDLGVVEPLAGTETLQAALTEGRCREIARTHGRADLVVARYLLEHAHDAQGVLAALRLMLSSEGYLAVEVPDCARAMEEGDAAMIWEEHILYFTAATLRAGLSGAGFSEARSARLPYVSEDALVVVGRAGARGVSRLSIDELEIEDARARVYAKGLTDLRQRAHQFLSLYREKVGKVAVFGAGHRSSTFINLLGLADVIEFVVDDQPDKQAFRMPGSGLAIRGSKSLLEEGIKLCLFGVSPEVEAKVMARSKEFMSAGGEFASLSPTGYRPLQKLAASVVIADAP